MTQSIVILGAGQAGAQVAQSLRMGGYDGRLTLVGEEAALPYQRPPLSKAYMKGEITEDRLYFKPAAWYEDQSVDVLTSTRAIAIDRKAQQVTLSHGAPLAYDALILATGSRPRPLPCKGADLNGVFDLRGLSDVERIRPNLAPGRHLLIIGAGYIGLEAAAVARQIGLDVTVVEMAPRVLARVTSPVMSAFFEAEHRARGVTIITEARVDELVGDGERVTGARLSDGRQISADLVLAGIGIMPNEELARDSGLACDNGIVVDEDARTSDPKIFAAGDCTTRPLVHYDRTGRLESVHNAIEQGKAAAAAILGKPRPAADCPWFWSDQYDLKLQIAGLSDGYDELVIRGSQADRSFAVFYLRDHRLIAVDAVNSPPEFIVSKKLITAHARPDPAQLTDLTLSMKEIGASVLSPG